MTTPSTPPSHPSPSDPNAWLPYRYTPSQAAAITMLIAFSLTTLLHTWQLYQRRTWYFIPLIIGGLFEILGFTGRLLSAQDPWALTPYIMQSLLLLLAPALFAASIYIVLGRIIQLVDGAAHCVIPLRWLTRVFVAGDVLSFVVQSGGGGIQAAGSLSMLHAGEKIIVVGLFLQLVFFGFFVVVAGLFHGRLVGARARARVVSMPASREVELGQMPWKRHMYALYTASALIMIRSIFRVVEYVQGNNGFLLRREVFLYLFDALLMLIVMVIFNWVHPAEVTDLHHKRHNDAEADYPLQATRERYMGSETGEN